VRNRVLKILVRLALSGLVIYALASRSKEMRAGVSHRDSIAYWAAGQLLLQHHNPYEANGASNWNDSRDTRRTGHWSCVLLLGRFSWSCR